MSNAEAAAVGGGEGTVPQLNCTENGVWTYSKAMQNWFSSSVKVGNNTNSAAASSTHVVAQIGVTKEAHQVSTKASICGKSTASTTRRASAAEVVQQPQGKKDKAKGGVSTVKRWENHNKETCKCAVCMQCRGELKSSWYKHDQVNCACAVCKQSRGESRPKGLGALGVGGGGRTLYGKDSIPSIPAKRASWLSLPEPSVGCWACSRELPRFGGGQLQTPSPFAYSQQSTSFPSCNKVLSSSLAAPPVHPESHTTTGLPLLWQQKLANLAGRTDCSSVRGLPSTSSSLLAPIPKCDHERLTCGQRLGCSCRVDNIRAEQQVQTNLFSKSRCSGWPSEDRTCSTNSTGSNPDGVQHWISDPNNMRRSCGHTAEMSYTCGTCLSWQNTVDRRQGAALPSTGLQTAESSPLETKKLNIPWESVQETSSSFSAGTERNGQWSTYPNLGNLAETELDAPRVPPDPFLSLRQSNSFYGGRPSIAHEQPDAASHSTIFSGMDFKTVYVPLQPSNSPDAPSSRYSSIAQFPFGLEVQAQAEHDLYHPISDLLAPIHTQSISSTYDEGIMESSSPPCETTSTTSILNEKDNCSPVMDVDSGDILRSSGAILQGGLETPMPLTDVDAGSQARDHQLQGGCEGGRPAKPVGQTSSKRLANHDDSHFTVHQKRAKREGVSHPVPKWCRLIHSKYDNLTIIRKIYIRSRVPKKCPESPKVMEPSVRNDEQNGNAGSPTLTPQGNNLEGRPGFEESIESSNLQTAGPTDPRESKYWKGAPDEFIRARREAFVVSEENIEELCESKLNKECSQESLNSINCFESSPETEAEDSSGEKKIRKLNCHGKIPERLGLQRTASVVQCNGNIHDESNAPELPSLLEAPDYTKDTAIVDISNLARKIKRSVVSAIDDHLGKRVQLADALIQNGLAKVSDSFGGRKRSSIGVEICSEGRESRLDPLRHLIPQVEEKDMLQPLKKRCERRGYHGASVATSVLCTDMEPLLRDPVRSTNCNSKPLILTIEILLPESMKVYYLTRILKARIPELTIWLEEHVRCMAHKSPSNFMVDSNALVPTQHTSLCSTPRVCVDPLYLLRRALQVYFCQKTTGFVTWSKVFSETRIHCPRNIGGGGGVNPSDSQLDTSSENISFGTRPRLDDELLRRFWHVHCQKNGFLLLPQDTLTVYMEDRLKNKLFDGMVMGSSSSLSTLRKYCFYSVLRDIGPNQVDLGGTKFEQEKMTAFGQHQQSLTQEAKLIPLRNIVFPCWIDKPLNGSIGLSCPGVRLKRSPPRFLSSTAAGDMCIASREQARTAKSDCTLQRRYSTGENLVDDLNAERQRREQIHSDGKIPEGYTSPPVNVQTRVRNIIRHEQTPGSSALHDECNTSIVPRPSVNSFQGLLGSVLQVDNKASPISSNTFESRTDPREKLPQISPSEDSRSIPGLVVWEHHSDLRNDGPTSATLTSSSDSMSKPVRRRGCPKGGWPKKNLSFPAANKYSLRSARRTLAGVDSKSLPKTRDRITKIAPAEDLSPIPPIDIDNTRSHHLADGDADIERPMQQINLSSPAANKDPEDRDNKYSLRSVSRSLAAVDPTSLTNGTKTRGGIRNTPGAEYLSPAPPVVGDNTMSQHKTVGEVEIEVIHPTTICSPKRQNTEFKMKLETFLDKPFQWQELKDLEGHAFLRKPLLRLRETRHRVLHVATRKEGMSYLDYHPDLARKVADAATPGERLRLLRGFFFWLQHSCTSGSFKPWAPDVDEVEKIDDDCVEIPKDRFVDHVHSMSPEAKATVERTAYQRDQASVGEISKTPMTLRTRAWKGKSSSRKTKSKHFSKQIKSSMERTVKTERK